MAPVMVKHTCTTHLVRKAHKIQKLKTGDPQKIVKDWICDIPEIYIPQEWLHIVTSCSYLIAFTCSLVFGVTPSMADWAIISVHMDTVNVLRWIRMAIHYAVVSTTTMLQTNSAIVIEKVETFTVWCIIILECLGSN